MLVFNIPKDETDIINEVSKKFENCEIVEVNSLGTDTIVQIIIPTLEIAVPTVSALIVAVVNKARQVEVEWNGIKIKGTERQVEKFLNTIVELDEKAKIKAKNNSQEKKKGKNS